MEEESILVSIKKLLGIDEQVTVFDQDIMIYINSAFSTLPQIGVMVDKRVKSVIETWSDVFGSNEDLIDFIKTYTYIKVRIIFDPPANSFVLNSLNEQLQELEWRIQFQAEGGMKDDG